MAIEEKTYNDNAKGELKTGSRSSFSEKDIKFFDAIMRNVIWYLERDGRKRGKKFSFVYAMIGVLYVLVFLLFCVVSFCITRL